MLLMFINTFKRWSKLLKMDAKHIDSYGDEVKELVEDNY